MLPLVDVNQLFADEVLLQIFKYSQMRDLLALSLVCKRWRVLVNDHLLWKHSFYSRFSHQIHSPPPSLPLGTMPEAPRYLRVNDKLYLNLVGLVHDPKNNTKERMEQTATGVLQEDVQDPDDAQAALVRPQIFTPLKQFTSWKHVYSVCLQLEEGSHCVCRNSSLCSCGSDGLDLWQIRFTAARDGSTNHPKRLTLLRKGIFQVLENRIQEEDANGSSLENVPTDQLSSSQLRMRKRNASNAAAAASPPTLNEKNPFGKQRHEEVSYWKLKPCPVSLTPQLVEWMRFRSLSYTVSLEYDPEGGNADDGGGEDAALQQADKHSDFEWPSLRLNPEIPVKPAFKLKCCDSSEDWGLKFSSWADGFRVEFYVKGRKEEFYCLSFGTLYELTHKDGFTPVAVNPIQPAPGVEEHTQEAERTLEVPESLVKGELERLCASPESLLRTVTTRYQELSRKICWDTFQRQGLTPQEGVGRGSLRLTRRGKSRLGAQVKEVDKAVRFKLKLLRKHHKQIHAALAKLLPSTIRTAIPFNS